MSSFHDSAFHIRVPSQVELNAFALQLILKRFVQKFLPLFVRTQTGRLRIGFEYLGSLRTY